MRMSRQLRDILVRVDDEISRDLLTSDKTDAGDYLGIRSGQLTYLPAGKDDTEPYKSKNRVRGKAARTARKFCTEEHTDAAYEQFHLRLLTRAFDEKNIDILKGDDIRRVYTDLYDRRRQSSMLASCMSNLDTEHYRLYVENPKYVRMLVLWDTFKGKRVVLGRALMWKTRHGIYIDRIYGSEPAIIFLRNYVDKKGWMRYTDRGRRGMREISTTVDIRWKAERDQWGYRKDVPYLDTFRLRLQDDDIYTVEGVIYANAN